MSKRQIQALPYLVTGQTLSEGAKLADISRRTLYYWLEDPEFRAEFERLREEAADIAKAELNGLMFKSALVLGEALEHENPNVRLRAAHIALSTGLKANDIKDIQRQLERLDDALILWKEKNQSW